ncbi:hypothetical protein TNCT_566541 [Trichonephila clavata]|uniref:Uncharacterized protein n=1 Tax=Trichonephila clavata TaxID=2740835 RepID=A0A8X6IJG3_TRICU|nr:hypothetical protein TNCT_566541 [Trichonephila clavata]
MPAFIGTDKMQYNAIFECFSSERWFLVSKKTLLSSTQCKQIYSGSLFWNGSRLKPFQSIILKPRDLITGDARLEE